MSVLVKQERYLYSYLFKDFCSVILTEKQANHLCNQILNYDYPDIMIQIPFQVKESRVPFGLIVDLTKIFNLENSIPTRFFQNYLKLLTKREIFMKRKFYATLFFSTLIGSTLLFSSGCTQKTVLPPPTAETAGQSGTYDGPDIPPALGDGEYSEENLPTEESLDATAQNGSDLNAEVEQTPEYLMEHGRSSIQFKPVYFSFDQTIIQPDMRSVIEANAKYMKDHPSIYVIIEGNTDERGTNEYNMALGERRAINVSKYMISLGVEKKRLHTVSLGEERPLFLEQSEEAFKYNRRADFRIK